MKQYFIFSLLFLIAFNISFADDARRLIILLDPNANELLLGHSNALLLNFRSAIEQKCSPIIVSKSIWDDFILRRYRIEQMINPKMISYEVLFHYWSYGILLYWILLYPDFIALAPFTLKNIINDLNAPFLQMKKELSEIQKKWIILDEKEQIETKKEINKIRTNYANTQRQIIEKHKKSIDIKFIEVLLNDLRYYHTPFNASDWIMRTYEDSLIVLVPRSYYAQCKQSVSQDYKAIAQEFITDKKTSLSLNELILGMKIDHLQPFSPTFEPTILQNFMTQYLDKPTHLAVLYDKALRDILITRSDLNLLTLKPKADPNISNPDKYEQLLHPWYIYISGHGSSWGKKPFAIKSAFYDIVTYGTSFFISIAKKTATIAQIPINVRTALNELNEMKKVMQQLPEHLTSGDIVCGLPISEFKKVLQFFNNQVLTRFLLYNTCFGGGINTQELFQFAQHKGRVLTAATTQIIPEEFNYTIAAGTTLDASTFTYAVFGISQLISDRFNIDLKFFDIIYICNFFDYISAYFGDSVKKTTNTISDIINEIYPFKPSSFSMKDPIQQYYNIPMIRFAHTPWFFIEDIDKEVMRITDMTVKIALTNNKPININNKKIVFLATPNIPVTVIIEGTLPTFLFAVPGNSNVHIKKLGIVSTSPVPNFLNDLLALFFKVNYQYYTKSCTIEEINQIEPNGGVRRFYNTVIVNGMKSAPGQPQRANFAYTEQDNGISYTAFGEKQNLMITTAPTALGEFGKNLYNKLSTPKKPIPEIEQGIEQKPLAEYPAKPIAQFLPKDLTELEKRRKEQEIKKQMQLRKQWIAHLYQQKQKPSAPSTAPSKIE